MSIEDTAIFSWQCNVVINLLECILNVETTINKQFITSRKGSEWLHEYFFTFRGNLSSALNYSFSSLF